MCKINECLEIAANNKRCVVFRVKPECRIDMIATGAFSGDEDLIRINKGQDPSYTVFRRNGTHYTWGYEKNETKERSEERKLMLDACRYFFVDLRRGHDFYENEMVVRAVCFAEDMVMEDASDGMPIMRFDSVEKYEKYYKDIGWTIRDKKEVKNDAGWPVYEYKVKRA